MLREVTYGELSVRIDEEALNDIEVFEMLQELDEGNPFLLPKLCKNLFGDEKYKEIKEVFRGDNGRVKATEMNEFLKYVFAESGDASKN